MLDRNEEQLKTVIPGLEQTSEVPSAIKEEEGTSESVQVEVSKEEVEEGKNGCNGNGRPAASGAGVKRDARGRLLSGHSLIGGGSKKGAKRTGGVILRQILDNAIEMASGGNVVEWWANFVRDYPRDAAKLRAMVEPKTVAVTTESRSLIVTIAGDKSKAELPALIGGPYPPPLLADDTQEDDVAEP